MKKIFLLFTLALLSFSATAQEANEEDTIINVIKMMFDGMRAGDSAMVGATFSEEMQMFTIFKTTKGDHMYMKSEPQKFLEAVGTPHDVVWDEIIWTYDVRIDGLLANVWTEYSFYAGKDFSHCGVNDFQLFKS